MRNTISLACGGAIGEGKLDVYRGTRIGWQILLGQHIVRVCMVDVLLTCTIILGSEDVAQMQRRRLREVLELDSRSLTPQNESAVVVHYSAHGKPATMKAVQLTLAECNSSLLGLRQKTETVALSKGSGSPKTVASNNADKFEKRAPVLELHLHGRLSRVTVIAVTKRCQGCARLVLLMYCILSDTFIASGVRGRDLHSPDDRGEIEPLYFGFILNAFRWIRGVVLSKPSMGKTTKSGLRSSLSGPYERGNVCCVSIGAAKQFPTQTLQVECRVDDSIEVVNEPQLSTGESSGPGCMISGVLGFRQHFAFVSACTFATMCEGTLILGMLEGRCRVGAFTKDVRLLPSRQPFAPYPVPKLTLLATVFPKVARSVETDHQSPTSAT
ncbi:hypothetical protein BU15DRAFT_63313 [Melanogaster broomeanus]|nr:hypothetical protein BU15DRAFT_63313 [Melanogaster broomeanus]